MRSLTLTVSDPVGQEVQTPPCFAQNEQVQARAGISDGFGRQSSANEILPQWQRPEINMALPRQPARRCAASLPPRGSGQGYHIGYAGMLEGELRALDSAEQWHDRCATGRCLNRVNMRRLGACAPCPLHR